MVIKWGTEAALSLVSGVCGSKYALYWTEHSLRLQMAKGTSSWTILFKCTPVCSLMKVSTVQHEYLGLLRSKMIQVFLPGPLQNKLMQSYKLALGSHVNKKILFIYVCEYVQCRRGRVSITCREPLKLCIYKTQIKLIIQLKKFEKVY